MKHHAPLKRGLHPDQQFYINKEPVWNSISQVFPGLINQKLWEQTSNLCLTLQVILVCWNLWTTDPDSGLPKLAVQQCHKLTSTVLPNSHSGKVPWGTTESQRFLSIDGVDHCSRHSWKAFRGRIDICFAKSAPSSRFAWVFAKRERTEGKSISLHMWRPGSGCPENPLSWEPRAPVSFPAQ